MKTEIKKAADGESWNLYVDGHVAVSYETYTVCSSVEAALKQPSEFLYYLEGAEIAAVIRETLA